MTENLSNKELFELFKKDLFDHGQATRQLWEFLSSAPYPWQLLGRPLEQFLAELVQSQRPDDRRKGSIHPGALLEGDDIVIEHGAIVEATAYITGPCYVCQGAVVRHGAYVRGHVFVGPNAVVGHTTEVKGSLLLAEAKAAHFAYVGNSILGCETNLGAGTKLANLRFDHGPISLRVPQADPTLATSPSSTGELAPVVNTGLKKFGAILGNRAQTGCNSVTNPGTILTRESWIRPGEVASGVVARRLPRVRN